MWLFSTIGFFSVVQKPGTDHLTVRARVRDDLEQLRAQYLPQLGATTAGGGTDYPYRATVSHDAFARACSKIIKDVTYDNFKNAVKAKLGAKRAAVCGKVWSAVRELEDLSPPRSPERASAKRTSSVATGSRPIGGKAMAYGGVVFDKEGRVLLVKPKGGFGGYAWTFPKGRPEPNETVEQAALREVFEESGVTASISSRIPGAFRGSTTDTAYFVMMKIRESGTFDPETERIEWITPEDAKTLIGQTPLKVGRDRDLQILSAALAQRHARPSA